MITPIGISAQSTGKVTTEANGKMGKMDFLKLLVSQMKFQDPLSPADSTQIAAQSAQFSQLEQMLNMTQAFTAMQQISMLGAFVSANGIDGSVITGRVASVNMNDDTPIMTLDNGAVVAARDIRQVSGTTMTTLQSVSLLGKIVSYYNPDGTTGSSRVLAVNLKKAEPELSLENGGLLALSAVRGVTY